MLRVGVSWLIGKIQDPECDLTAANLPRRLHEVQNSTFTTALTKYTRMVATHIFVFMISPSKRDKKPYAIPIQCVSYCGMKRLHFENLQI